MIGRRGLLAGLAATMSWRGGDPGPAGMRGGLPQPRFDQIHNPPAPPTPTGSAAGTFRGRLVVVFGHGPNTGVFVYDPAPGPANLVASIASVPGTDPYGNAYLGGLASYSPLDVPAIAVGIDGAQIEWFTGPFGGPGPWTGVETVELFGGNLVLGGGSGSASITLQSGVDRVDFDTFIKLNARAVPPGVPTGGGYVYVNAGGALHYKGPSGTDTMIAPA